MAPAVRLSVGEETPSNLSTVDVAAGAIFLAETPEAIRTEYFLKITAL